MPPKYPICTPTEVHKALMQAGFWDVKQTGRHLGVIAHMGPERIQASSG